VIISRERLLALAPLLVSVACGTNENTVASEPGSGAAAGVTGRGGSGAAGASGGSDGGLGGTEQGGAGASGGTVVTGGSDGGGSGGEGGSAATGGTASGGAAAGRGGASGNGASAGAGVGAGAGGMGGNAGAGGGWSSPCEDNLDCLVMPASCCGACGVATRTDVIALNQADGEAYRREVCDNIACPGCAGQPDPTLMAACIGGRCAVVDILTHEVTTCASPADCRVRASGCCDCGVNLEPRSLIAVNPKSPTRYEELACNRDSVCAACIPQYPAVTIDCLNNHCQIVP
jgi:hypothetical protein